MKKQNLFLFVLLLISIVAFIACKTSDETPTPPQKPKGTFSIYDMKGVGYRTFLGSTIFQLYAYVKNTGSVAGHITATVFKISRDSTLIYEISYDNYSSFGLFVTLNQRSIGIGGTGGVAYAQKPSTFLPQWTTVPNKVDVIFYITDDNGYTQELPGTTTFTVMDL